MTPASILVFIATIQMDYDDHTFGVNGSDSSFVLINDSGWIPKVQDSYVVHNIGRTKVEAQLWYGDEVQWFGVIDGATILPGELKVINTGDKPYYYTGLKLINNQHVRAIVHGEGGYLPTPFIPNLNIDISNVLLKALQFCVKYFSNKIVAFAFKELTSLFWPINRPNIWEEVSAKVYVLLDENTRQILTAILENKMKRYKERISTLAEEIENKTSIQQAYMALAYDLIGLEAEFSFSNVLKNNDNINLYILPMYSNVISMKINFYMLGVKYKDELGLSEPEIIQIENYANRTFTNALNYINNISVKAVEYMYNNSEAPRIFNNMMTTRSHVTIHGLEYLPIWKFKLDNPSSNEEIYNPVISYSTFFGRPTANLYAQATPVEVPPPLCPKLVNNKRNKLIKFLIYMWCKDPSILKIGGAKLIFENGDEYTTGTVTAIVKFVDLQNATVLQINAYGDGKVDGLKFYLSNGNVEVFGQFDSKTNEELKLQDHYISSFYISSDNYDLDGQAANIAVSFQWFVKNN